jgi:hypothetical protein
MTFLSFPFLLLLFLSLFLYPNLSLIKNCFLLPLFFSWLGFSFILLLLFSFCSSSSYCFHILCYPEQLR